MGRRNRRIMLTLAAVALAALVAWLVLAGRQGAPALLSPLGHALGVVCMEFPSPDLPPWIDAFPREVPCPPVVYLDLAIARVAQALPAAGGAGPPLGALLAGPSGFSSAVCSRAGQASSSPLAPGSPSSDTCLGEPVRYTRSGTRRSLAQRHDVARCPCHPPAGRRWHPSCGRVGWQRHPLEWRRAMQSQPVSSPALLADLDALTDRMAATLERLRRARDLLAAQSDTGDAPLDAPPLRRLTEETEQLIATGDALVAAVEALARQPRS